MENSIISLPFNIQTIFKIQNLLSINLGSKKRGKEDFIEKTKENILNSYMEIKEEYKTINFYDAPKNNEEFTQIRENIQKRSQNEMRAQMNKIRAISGASGSHEQVISRAIGDKYGNQIRDIADRTKKNIHKKEYILNSLSGTTSVWTNTIDELLQNQKIDITEYDDLSKYVNGLSSNTQEYVEVSSL